MLSPLTEIRWLFSVMIIQWLFVDSWCCRYLQVNFVAILCFILIVDNF